jgi:hypothetical protein
VTFEPPLALYPRPDIETAPTLRFELPVFVKLISCDVAAPTITFPKLKL